MIASAIFFFALVKEQFKAASGLKAKVQFSERRITDCPSGILGI
jgi:hypothetical protein